MEEKSDQYNKNSRKLSGAQQGVSKGAKLLGQVIMGVNKVRDPFSFQFLCLSSSYLLSL